MKTGVSLSAFPARKGMPVLFSEATKENLETIKRLGFDGVDLFVRDPESKETRDALLGLEKYGLGIGVIMPAALAREGLFLGSSMHVIREEALRKIKDIIKLAGTCGAMVSLGLVRGSKEEEEALASFYTRFTDSCLELLKEAQPIGVNLVIEPINRYEINTINSLQECITYIKDNNLPIHIMADTFHMNIEDIDLTQTLRESLLYTKHIHFVDSNRLAPSMGHMDLESMYQMLVEENYQGYLCMEVMPFPDPITNATIGSNFFQAMKEKYGG